jgi:hypothetical protein
MPAFDDWMNILITTVNNLSWTDDAVLGSAGWLSPDQVKDLADSEDGASAAQRAFYHAALPALPALLLGLLCLEGRHLVGAKKALAKLSSIAVHICFNVLLGTRRNLTC